MILSQMKSNEEMILAGSGEDISSFDFISTFSYMISHIFILRNLYHRAASLTIF